MQFICALCPSAGCRSPQAKDTLRQPCDKKEKALQEIDSSAPLLLCLLLYTVYIESQTLLYTIIHCSKQFFCDL